MTRIRISGVSLPRRKSTMEVDPGRTAVLVCVVAGGMSGSRVFAVIE